MPKKQEKNLSFDKIKKVSKKVDSVEKYEIKDGHYKGSFITYQPLFDNVKLEELFIEYGMLLNEADEVKIELSEQVQLYLIEILIIKYFTHFNKDLPNFLLGEEGEVGLLDALLHFRKTGLLDECFNNIFSPVEVRKVFEKLTDISAKGMFALDLNEKVTQKISELQIKNKDIFEKLDLN